jgi:hypothetical protein
VTARLTVPPVAATGPAGDVEATAHLTTVGPSDVVADDEQPQNAISSAASDHTPRAAERSLERASGETRGPGIDG